MKKSLKRFLIILQVLGWSALLASACTDEQVKIISQNTASHEDNKAKSHPNSSNNGTNSESDSMKTGADSKTNKTQSLESPTSQSDTQQSQSNVSQSQGTKENNPPSSKELSLSREHSGAAAKPDNEGMNEQSQKAQKEKEEQANKAEQEEAEKNAAQQKLENEKKMQGSSGHGTPGEAGAEDKGAGTGTTTEHPIPSQPPVTSHGQEATDQTSH